VHGVCSDEAPQLAAIEALIRQTLPREEEPGSKQNTGCRKPARRARSFSLKISFQMLP
jgi:hypothetical protein